MSIMCTVSIVKFAVTDEGAGISDADQALLFQPFVQIRAHEQQQGGGSGIGLSLCKQVVELHGGSIHVESTVGGGSTFSFILPLMRPSEEPLQQARVSMSHDIHEFHSFANPDHLHDSLMIEEETQSPPQTPHNQAAKIVEVDDMKNLMSNHMKVLITDGKKFHIIHTYSSTF